MDPNSDRVLKHIRIPKTTDDRVKRWAEKVGIVGDSAAISVLLNKALQVEDKK